MLHSLSNMLLLAYYIQGAKVVVQTDSDKTVKNIYFQINVMVRTFHTYPELLLIDATYKLNDQSADAFVCTHNSRWK